MKWGTIQLAWLTARPECTLMSSKGLGMVLSSECLLVTGRKVNRRASVRIHLAGSARPQFTGPLSACAG